MTIDWLQKMFNLEFVPKRQSQNRVLMGIKDVILVRWKYKTRVKNKMSPSQGEVERSSWQQSKGGDVQIPACLESLLSSFLPKLSMVSPEKL